MDIFWAIIVTVILTLIVWGVIKSGREKKKNKKIAERYLREVDDYVRSGDAYTVVLADGKRFENAKIVGYSQFNDGVLAAGHFPMGKWMILELPDTRRIFLRPQAIRYFEQFPKQPNQLLRATGQEKLFTKEDWPETVGPDGKPKKVK